MRPVGILLLLAGIALVLVAFVMGSTVESYSAASGLERYGIPSALSQQTYNLPKAQTQMMLMLSGLSAALAGIVLLSVASLLDGIREEGDRTRTALRTHAGEIFDVAIDPSAAPAPARPTLTAEERREFSRKQFRDGAVVIGGIVLMLVVFFGFIAAIGGFSGPNPDLQAEQAADNLEATADRLEQMANEAERTSEGN